MQPTVDDFDAATQPGSGPLRALVALGANLPSEGRTPEDTVRQAFEMLIEATGGPARISQLYRTPAFPTGAGPDFVNAAADLPWTGDAQSLLALLHRVEGALGRTRMTRWEARILDLDLLALGDTVLPDPQVQAKWANLPPDRAATLTPDHLILPHPRLTERAFVLVPLAEIAPDWVHPMTGTSIADLVQTCPAEDLAEIWPLAPAPTGKSEA